MTRLDLNHELSDRAPVPFQMVSGAYLYQDRTPCHQYTTVIGSVLDGEYYVALPARDSFDEHFAAAILAFISIRSSAFSVTKPLVILEGFAYRGYSFDCIALLSPFAAKQYEHENEALNLRTFVAFPMYRCELSGNESSDLINVIRHDVLPSLDWKRPPAPKIKMAIRSGARNTKRSKNGLTLTTLQHAIAALDHLAESKNGWLILENYSGQQCRVAWDLDHYNIKLPDRDAIPCARASAIELVNRFATSRV